MLTQRPILINFIGFQSAWWLLVLGAGQRWELIALVYGALLASAQLYGCKNPLREIKLASLALLVGVLLDSACQGGGVILFRGISMGGFSPFWLWELWVLLALTLNSSLGFLQRWPLWVTALLGGVAGPASYYAGTQLGAGMMVASPQHLGLLALAWMLALPLLVKFARA